MSVYMLTYIFVHCIKILKLATDDFHFNFSTINIIRDILTYYKTSSVPFHIHGNSVFFNDSFSQTLYNLFLVPWGLISNHNLNIFDVLWVESSHSLWISSNFLTSTFSMIPNWYHLIPMWICSHNSLMVGFSSNISPLLLAILFLTHTVIFVT